MIMTEAYQTAYNMVNKWLTDGEVSGTDHYIGKEYDEEEFENLRLIRALIYRELGLIKDKEVSHETNNQELNNQ